MLENIYRHLTRHAEGRPADKEARLSDKVHHVLMAAVEVDKPILFSVLITIAAFLPLFTMQGVEGQIFGPMARTYAYALIGAVIATFTVTPVLSTILLPDRVEEIETFWSAGFGASTPSYFRAPYGAIAFRRWAPVVLVHSRGPRRSAWQRIPSQTGGRKSGSEP